MANSALFNSDVVFLPRNATQSAVMPQYVVHLLSVCLQRLGVMIT